MIRQKEKGNQSMNLIRVTEENIEEAVSVQKELFPEESGRANYEEAVSGVSGFEYYLVYKDGVCAGITGIYTYPDDPQSAWLGWFCIREEYRRRHLGSKTMTWFEETARERGFHFTRLYTDAKDNETAIAFYKANGYTPEPYLNPQDPASMEIEMLIFSKAIGNEPLVLWNNRNIHLTGQLVKQRKNRKE